MAVLSSVAYSEIADAVLLTQNKLVKRGAFVDMQTDLTDHVACKELWKRKQWGFSGGKSLEIEYQMNHNNTAKAVGLYETDTNADVQTMVKGEVPVRHMNAHYIYDLREAAFQRGGAEIVNHVKTKYTAMMVSFYESLESILWGKPATSADVKTPYGMKYWLTRNASEGFNGGNPTGFSSGRAGIDSGSYDRYKNWTSSYSDVTREDLLRKMKRAARKIRFKSPVLHATPSVNMSRGIYTNDDVLSEMEELLEDRNMSLGNDLGKYQGSTIFKSTPITYVPFLDDDSGDPVYMIDWNWMFMAIMKGWESNLSSPTQVYNQHLVRRVDLDATLNMVCTDPRRQAVFHKA